LVILGLTTKLEIHISGFNEVLISALEQLEFV